MVQLIIKSFFKSYIFRGFLFKTLNMCVEYIDHQIQLYKNLLMQKDEILYFQTVRHLRLMCVYIYTVCKSFCMQYECPYISIRFINPSNLPTCTCTCTCNPLPPECNAVLSNIKICTFRNIYV